MQHNKKRASSEKQQREAKWHLDGWHAVTSDRRERVYVRDFLDFGSYEFSVSKLNCGQRLAIIASIGELKLFRVMKEISNEKGRKYRKENFKVDLTLLRIFAAREIPA
jgi:hypothetical protein